MKIKPDLLTHTPYRKNNSKMRTNLLTRHRTGEGRPPHTAFQDAAPGQRNKPRRRTSHRTGSPPHDGHHAAGTKNRSPPLSSKLSKVRGLDSPKVRGFPKSHTRAREICHCCMVKLNVYSLDFMQILLRILSFFFFFLPIKCFITCSK